MLAGLLEMLMRFSIILIPLYLVENRVLAVIVLLGCGLFFGFLNGPFYNGWLADIIPEGLHIAGDEKPDSLVGHRAKPRTREIEDCTDHDRQGYEKADRHELTTRPSFGFCSFYLWLTFCHSLSS